LLRLSAAGVGADLRFGTHLAGQRLVNYVAGNADFFLVGTILGSQALGLYTIAFNLANLPSSQVNAIINRVSFPAMSRVQTDSDRLINAYMRLHGASSALNWPLMLGLAAVASDLLPLVLGPSWQDSVLLFQVLCLMGVARAVAGTVGPLLLARGETARGLRWSIFLACTMVPSLWCGVMWGGLLGLAIAYALFQALVLVPNYILLLRPILGPCLRAYSIASTFAAAPALAAALAMVAYGAATQLSAVVTVLVQVVIGIFVYLGLMVGLFGSQLRANLEVLKTREPGPTSK
jgi:lipopolysaccharide exporter